MMVFEYFMFGDRFDRVFDEKSGDIRSYLKQIIVWSFTIHTGSLFFPFKLDFFFKPDVFDVGQLCNFPHDVDSFFFIIFK